MKTRQYVYPVLLAALMLPAAAMAQQVTANLDVSITINDGCTINAGPLAFDQQSVGFGTDVDNNATITVSCTAGTNYNVQFGPGQNANGGTQRRMASGNDLVDYQIYLQPERTTVLGVTNGTDTIAAAGTGSAEPHIVYGRVPGGQTLVAGSYTDVVQMTVVY